MLSKQRSSEYLYSETKGEGGTGTSTTSLSRQGRMTVGISALKKSGRGFMFGDGLESASKLFERFRVTERRRRDESEKRGGRGGEGV